MLTISVKRLMNAIEEANAFSLPEMSTGAEYLYANLYNRLAADETVLLSELDFDAFELDDVDYLGDLHSDVLEQNEYRAHNMMCSLRSLPAVAAAAAFV